LHCLTIPFVVIVAETQGAGQMVLLTIIFT